MEPYTGQDYLERKHTERLIRLVEDGGLPPPLSKFCSLAARDWEVVNGQNQFGVGDLVFANADFSEYLIVEVKALHQLTGPTAHTSRRKARQKVAEQVQRYMKHWANQHPGKAVYGVSYVDEVFGEVRGPLCVSRNDVHGRSYVERGSGRVRAPLREPSPSEGSVTPLVALAGVTAGLAGLAYLFQKKRGDST